LPVLVLARGVVFKSQQSRSFGSIVCVDKRDGRVLMAADEVPLPATAVTLSIDSDPQQKKVAIHLGTRTYTLTFSDEPLPPAAPVQTGDASSLLNPLTSNRVKQWAGAIVEAFGGEGTEKQEEGAKPPQP
jgi:hypothetical protein